MPGFPTHEGVLEGMHVGAGHGAARDRCQGEPGVVVEDVEDLHRGAVGELPVGGVGQVGADRVRAGCVSSPPSQARGWW